MDSFDYASKIFHFHLNEYKKIEKEGYESMLEIGPGKSIASALLGYAYGFKKIYLIDVGDFAIKDINFYKKFAINLKNRGYLMPDISNAKSLKDILIKCNAEYLVNGLSSFKKIKSNSIDFSFSHSVLEHIRKREFIDTILQLKRIMRKHSVSSHIIDYQDHLNKSLNNLRFSEGLWESDLFANSGFYTNRIPAIKIHKYFCENGFKILKENFGKWPRLPIYRQLIHPDFDIYKDSDLLNRTSSILLLKK